MEKIVKYKTKNFTKYYLVIKMKAKGLGDTIHNITTKTGVKTVVDKISKGLNVPCGCEGRRQALNRLVPYNKQFKLKK